MVLWILLAKCVLSSPAAGYKVPWREILHWVGKRLRKWFVRNVALYGQRPVLILVYFPNVLNVRRARLAIEIGQFSKAIQVLSFEGLASPSPQSSRKCKINIHRLVLPFCLMALCLRQWKYLKELSPRE